MNTENASPFQQIPERETDQAAASSTDGWSSRNHISMLVLLAATSIGIYLCYRLAEPFLPALAWALALAQPPPVRVPAQAPVLPFCHSPPARQRPRRSVRLL